MPCLCSHRVVRAIDRPAYDTVRAMRVLVLAIAAAVALGAPSHAQLRALEPLDASGRVTYFIAPALPGSEYRAGDRELATWALNAWAKATGSALTFEPSAEDTALLQVHWVPASAGQYGEMRPLLMNGRRGAAVYIRPDVRALGPDIAKLALEDPLFRDTIVYLTCVHELGHALGLGHTADFRDIMYSFTYGGDIPEFFMRYRRQLATRADIAKVSGLSDADVAALRVISATR